MMSHCMCCLRFMYPNHMLSSHFLTEEQKTNVWKAASEVRGHNFHSLLSSEDCRRSCEQLKACIRHVSQTLDKHYSLQFSTHTYTCIARLRVSPQFVYMLVLVSAAHPCIVHSHAHACAVHVHSLITYMYMYIYIV